jgi:hypothetical protein
MKMLGNLGNSLRAYACAAAARNNVSEERNDKQSLLGAVEVMDKEVAVNVPSVKFVGMNVFAVKLGGPEIDNQAVPPFSARRVYPILSTAELANGSPSLWRKLGGVEGVMMGHVGPRCIPGRLI